MTDRELLELAYRAYAPGENYIRMVNVAGVDYWNPLTDDGDALRLAVKLRLEVVPLEGGGVDVIHWRNGMESVHVCESGIDELAATRRAIVRAAAEIGKEMK